MAQQKIEPVYEQYEVLFDNDRELHVLSVVTRCLARQQEVLDDPGAMNRIMDYLNSKYSSFTTE